MMRQQTVYYKLGSRSDEPMDTDRIWLELERSRYCCPACGGEYPKVGGLEPIVADTRGGRSQFRLPLDFISPITYAIVRDDLLAVLAPESHEQLNLGMIIDENGRQIPNYHTAQAKISVLVRGGPGSKNNGLCRECGRRRYYPMPHGYGYLLRSTFPKDVQILRVREGIAVNQAIRDRIVAAGLSRGMYIVRLPVLDEPEDGLPADLKFYEKI